MFSIKGDKALGLDGFSTNFFRKSWSIVGKDVIQAMKDIFRTGRLLREVNATIFTLVPKKKNPSAMGDYQHHKNRCKHVIIGA
jgi:hypothetical protein